MADGRKQTGDRGEALAARLLEGHGFQVLERNWTCRYGELDLICADGATRVFVEVRTRSQRRFGRPEASIGHDKRAALVRAAQRWLAKHPEDEQRPLRFDVVAVDLTCTPACLRHHRDAFDLNSIRGPK